MQTSVSLEWDAPKDNGARIDTYVVEAEALENADCRVVYNGQLPKCVVKDLKVCLRDEHRDFDFANTCLMLYWFILTLCMNLNLVLYKL